MFGKVIALALALAFVVSGSLSAGDSSRSIGESSEVFVGVELDGTFIQGEPFDDLAHEGSGISFGLRLGAQNEKWRSMVVLDCFNSDDDEQKYERAMIQVDYYLFSSQFSTVAFRPYVGISGGYLNYEVMNNTSDTAMDESGFTYGGQIGFTADIANIIDLDISYRYAVVNFEELGNIGNLVVGINYFY